MNAGGSCFVVTKSIDLSDDGVGDAVMGGGTTRITVAVLSHFAAENEM